MNKHDPHQPPAYQVPPGWERFQPPAIVEPVLQAVMAEDSPPRPVRVQPRVSAWLRFWRQMGGGSLMLSIAVHVGLLLLAGLIIVGSQIAKPAVDFIPAGGAQTNRGTIIDKKYRVRMNHLTAMAKRPTQTRIGVEGSSGPALPEAGEMVLPEAGQGMAATGGRLSTASLGSSLGLDGTGPTAVMPLMPLNFC